MAKKAARQMQYVLDSEYMVTGPSGKERRLVFKGRLRIGAKRFLIFRPVRANRKRNAE